MHLVSPLYAILSVSLLACFTGCENRAALQQAWRAAIEKAEAQVERIAEELDKRTTEAGVYVRVKDGEVNEKDPWGTPIKVSYSQGGVAEVLSVRSAGPDHEFNTDDDLVAQGLAMNLKGIGEGLKQNIEETAAKAAKGIVKGTVEGVKESIRDSLPGKKKKNGEAETKHEDR